MYIYKHIRQSIVLILGLIFLAQNTYSQKIQSSDSIYVIVGSFKNQYNAIYLERDLRKKGFKNAALLNRKNGFYRVSIDRFSKITEAKNFIEENQFKKSEFWYQYSNGKIIKNYDDKLNKITAESNLKSNQKERKEVKKTEPTIEFLKNKVKETIY